MLKDVAFKVKCVQTQSENEQPNRLKVREYIYIRHSHFHDDDMMIKLMVM